VAQKGDGRLRNEVTKIIRNEMQKISFRALGEECVGGGSKSVDVLRVTLNSV
jgi:hypothetical protein